MDFIGEILRGIVSLLWQAVLVLLAGAGLFPRVRFPLPGEEGIAPVAEKGRPCRVDTGVLQSPSRRRP